MPGTWKKLISVTDKVKSQLQILHAINNNDVVKNDFTSCESKLFNCTEMPENSGLIGLHLCL